MMPSITSRVLLAALLALPLGGCGWFGGGDKSDSADVPADAGNIPVETLYNRGVDAMNSKKYETAAQQFDLVEQNYPYSSWAVNAQLMEGYAQYLQEHYTDAIGTLGRFIQLHPAHRDIAYAYYLRSLCYYEQISDIQRDQKATQEAIAALQEVISRFPDSAYARDAKLKIDLCRDHLAGKEMEIGRFYEREHLYTAAINRFQRVVDNYQTTNHTPEALQRLTEIYLKLGLVSEARRTASVLGYNYPGSSWYEKSYDDLIATGSANDHPAVAATDGSPAPGTPAAPVASVAPPAPAAAAAPVISPAPPTPVASAALPAPGAPAASTIPAAPAASATPATPAASAAPAASNDDDAAPHRSFLGRLWNSVF